MVYPGGMGNGPSSQIVGQRLDQLRELFRALGQALTAPSRPSLPIPTVPTALR